MSTEERIGSLEEQINLIMQQLNSCDEYVTPEQLAEKMQCTRRHVYEHIRKGNIAAVKIGALVRIPMKQFEQSPVENAPLIKKRKVKELSEGEAAMKYIFG